MATDLGSHITRRTLDTDAECPTAEIRSIVAELEGKNPTELPRAWRRIDSLLADLFSDPPSPEASAKIQFSYEGYRITVEQDGRAEFIRTVAPDSS